MICSRGSVYLVGAGPGDPELITVRGMRLIQSADTIIHDRLIPHEVLEWSRTDATIINVGKSPSRQVFSQAEINALLVRHARLGETVVRLKGGDPFVFGRGQEEFAACQDAKIPCHVIPGVTSAIAGPAAAGIPVTSRGIARSFTVVTGQTSPELDDHQLDFSALANTDTLVLMMARRNLGQLTRSLIESGRNPETPVACIERATFVDQRVTVATLREIAAQVDRLNMTNPMVTVIGDVAALVNPDLVQSLAEDVECFYAFEFGE